MTKEAQEFLEAMKCPRKAAAWLQTQKRADYIGAWVCEGNMKNVTPLKNKPLEIEDERTRKSS